MKDEGEENTKMDCLVDVANLALGGEEQEDGVTLFGLGHSSILNKAKVHRVKLILFSFVVKFIFILLFNMFYFVYLSIFLILVVLIV